jgi:hypothetical protein
MKIREQGAARAAGVAGTTIECRYHLDGLLDG